MNFSGKAALFVLGFCVLGCASLTVDRNTHDYPQQSKDLFVSSCVKNGGNEAQCKCLLGKVEEKYTYGEMDDAEQKIKSGNTPPEFTDFMTKAAQECKSAGSAPAPAKSEQPGD